MLKNYTPLLAALIFAIGIGLMLLGEVRCSA